MVKEPPADGVYMTLAEVVGHMEDNGLLSWKTMILGLQRRDEREDMPMLKKAKVQDDAE